MSVLDPDVIMEQQGLGVHVRQGSERSPMVGLVRLRHVDMPTASDWLERELRQISTRFDLLFPGEGTDGTVSGR